MGFKELLQGNPTTTNEDKQTKMGDQVINKYDFQCPCGYTARNNTQRSLDLMERLHSKRCDEYEKQNMTYTTELEITNEKKKKTRKTTLRFDNEEEYIRRTNAKELSNSYNRT